MSYHATGDLTIIKSKSQEVAFTLGFQGFLDKALKSDYKGIIDISNEGASLSLFDASMAAMGFEHLSDTEYTGKGGVDCKESP